MIATVTSADPAGLASFDDIIDVRSPAEFAEDHIPGAISLPVLDNDERALVGTIYVQDSRFRARRIGAALVARNIARHLEEGLKDRPGSWATLVYCWRGGQRSNAMATVLEQVGWRVSLLAGGYKTYRRRVTAALYDARPAFRVILLDGYTGVAKTDILGRLAGLGVQTIDLEGLARHRGSLFGGLGGDGQPHQKLFESRLMAALDGLDRTRPVVLEAESSKVGDINLPPVLWRAMLAAPRLILTAPRPDRARYLLEAYGEITRDRDALAGLIARLPPHHGRERIALWRSQALEGRHADLAEGLMEFHYDPAYVRSSRGHDHATLAEVSLPDLSPDSRQTAAGTIARLLEDPP